MREPEYEDLADLVLDRMDEGSIADVQVQNALYEGLIELGANAQEHSETDKVFVAAQVYLRGYSNEYVVLAVGDAGCGLRQSLERLAPETDRDALELAVTDGVSGIDDVGRGYGLPTTIESARRLTGTSVLRSGTARKIVYRRSSAESNVPDSSGTVVGVKIRTRPGR